MLFVKRLYNPYGIAEHNNRKINLSSLETGTKIIYTYYCPSVTWLSMKLIL
ncbi:hypothetical protein H6768_03575 [Candidatus Peribacteria bacterium]|nr:hypothetical protein [Candidatus Peribacteria bacterium]